MSPKPGDLVGEKYRIEQSLGRGGMGEVFAALDTKLERAVAIKVLLPIENEQEREKAVARFLREGRAAAALRSEHAVRILEVDAHDGSPYLVMERLCGTDLGAQLKASGTLPIEDAVEYVLQACEAIAEAHSLGIVHRDLKPSNLFLTRDEDEAPCVKVLDFGISKDTASDAQLTATDAVVGSPMYMSPEQVRSSKHVDARSDLWSLGVVLYELLAGVGPFEAPSTTALCVMIVNDPPTPLREKRADAPEGIEEVIDRCLQKKPSERFQDVGELATALVPFARDRARTSAERITRILGAAAVTARAPSEEVTDAKARPAATVAPAPATEPKRSRMPLVLAAVLIVGLAAAWRLRPTSTPIATTATATATATPTPTERAAPAPSEIPISPEPTTTSTSHATRPTRSLDAGTPKDAGGPKDAGAKKDAAPAQARGGVSPAFWKAMACQNPATRDGALCVYQNLWPELASATAIDDTQMPAMHLLMQACNILNQYPDTRDRGQECIFKTTELIHSRK